MLLIQWDGFVVNPEAWRNEFLACDYLGAKWFWGDPTMRVGNGGFSLRSRKLLAALRDPRIVLSGAEDETICRIFRPLLEQEYGIVFGSEKLADAFAFEAAYPIGKPFGFHGLYNFCRVMPAHELAELTPAFTPAMARSPQLLQLGRNCLALGQWQPAAAIFHRILEQAPDHLEAQAGVATAAGACRHGARGRPQRSLSLRQREALQALSRGARRQGQGGAVRIEYGAEDGAGAPPSRARRRRGGA